MKELYIINLYHQKLKMESSKKELGYLIGFVFQTIDSVMEENGIDEETREEVLQKLSLKHEKEKLRILCVPGETRGAPKRPRKNNSTGIVWVFHPKTKDFSYSSNMSYNNKKFVKDNLKKTIVATIDDVSIKSLDEEDKIFLKSKSLSYEELEVSEY